MVIQSEGDFYFRNGILEFFELIEEFNIPLFIISACVNDIIEIILESLLSKYSTLISKGLLYIMGNKFNFDENDNIIGYEKPMITTFNKNLVFF